jgi:hypothetical protein
MAAADYFVEVGDPGSATTLDSNYTIADSTVTVVSTTNWPSTGKAVIFAIDSATVIDGKEVQTAGTYCEFEGTVASATSITNVDYKRGDGDQNFSAGSLTRVYIPVSAERENRLITGLTTEHAQDGTHSAITGTSATFTGAVTAGSFVESGTASNGWQVGLGDTPDTVTNNGNRSYDLVFNSTDHTDVISPGMRLRTTRTSAAPNQCADLESGSSQYFSKSSPTGLSITTVYTAMAWVKLESYTGSTETIISQTDAVDGWIFYITSTGQVGSFNKNSASTADTQTSYQSAPLGRWVHVACSVDMTGNSILIYIDGILVPSSGTNGTSTSITDVGNLALGAYGTGTNYLDAKFCQVGLFDAVISQANIRDYMTHGLAGTETNCVGAWSLDNDITDLNSNGNDLTAQGGALATDTDSPFGDGGTSTTLDYGIVTAATFSTNTTLTVQVPEGCTIDTSGGISAVAYSTSSVPYGFVRDEGRWVVETKDVTSESQSSPVSGTWYNIGGLQLSVPIGAWKLSYSTVLVSIKNGINSYIQGTLSTTTTTESNDRWSSFGGSDGATATTNGSYTSVYVENGVSLSAADIYYLNLKTITSGHTSYTRH